MTLLVLSGLCLLSAGDLSGTQKKICGWGWSNRLLCTVKLALEAWSATPASPVMWRALGYKETSFSPVRPSASEL